MKILLLISILASFSIGINLSCEELEPCLDSDYRYLLQRAWDESSNIQFIKIANTYLKKLKIIKPECGSHIDREILQNDLKISSIKSFNSNTYPFAFAFSNFTKNQKIFTDGIQVAIDDGMNEMKTVLEKIVVREGQIPILFLVESEKDDFNQDKLEIYFTLLFKNVEGNYLFSPYNRLEHTEIFENQIPDGKLLKKEILEKIYENSKKIDKWKNLFIIRLTEKSIFKKNGIYNQEQNEKLFSNQSYITLDLFKIGYDEKNNFSINLMGSADVTGIKKEVYYEESFKSIDSVIFGLIFLLLLSILYIFHFLIQNKKIINNSIVNSNLTKVIFAGLIYGCILLLVTFSTFPSNILFEKIIGDWMDINSKTTPIILGVVVLVFFIIFLVLSYIATSKFVDHSYLLEKPTGLPLLWSISFSGFSVAIIYNILIYLNLYNIFILDDNFNYHYYMELYIVFIIFLFYYAGLNFQILLKNKSFMDMMIYSKNNNEIQTNNTFSEIKNTYQRIISVSMINLIFFLLLICVLSLVILTVGFVIFILMSDFISIVNIWNIDFYTTITLLFVPIVLTHIQSLLLKNIKFDDFEEENIIYIEKLNSVELFNSYFKTEEDEFRFIFNKKPPDIDTKENFIFIQGDEKSGKKEKAKKIIEQLRNENQELKDAKVLEFNFSDSLSHTEERTKFIEIGKYYIPKIASLHGSRNFGNIIDKNSKNPLLSILDEIPGVGKLLNFLVKSEKITDNDEAEENLLAEVQKIYVDYINDNRDGLILLFENIQGSNNFSFEIILKILNTIKKNLKDTRKLLKNNNSKFDIINYNVYVIITSKPNIEMNMSENEGVINNINLQNYVHIKRKEANIKNDSNSRFNFCTFNIDKYDLIKFKFIMKENFNFARTLFNDKFIEKLFITIKVNNSINFYELNLILRHYFKNGRFNFTRNRIYLREYENTILLPEEITNHIRGKIETLKDDEKDLIIALAHMSDNFTINQISYTTGMSKKNVQSLISNMDLMHSNLYLERESDYLRLNPKVRDYLKETFKTYFINFKNKNRKDHSTKILKLKFFAENFFNHFRNEKIDSLENYSEILTKLSYFSFILNNSHEIFEINWLFIRDSYFKLSNKFKVNEALVNYGNLKIKPEKYYFLYALHYENDYSILPSHIKKDMELVHDKEDSFYLLAKIIVQNKDYTLLLSNRNINTKIGLEDFQDREKMLESTLPSLIKNYEILINSIRTNEDPLLQGWVIFYLCYFSKVLALKKENKTLKEIHDLFPNLSLDINETTTPFDTFLPVYEFCLLELDKIQEKMKVQYDRRDVYESINYKILVKEIKHLEIRVKNTYFELYITNIKNRVITEEQRFEEMDKKIELDLKSTIQEAGDIGNEIGQAISENLLSYFYFYKEDIKRSFYHSKKSYYLNEKIKNYKGMELAFNEEKIQKFSTNTQVLTDKMQATLQFVQRELSQIKDDNGNL